MKFCTPKLAALLFGLLFTGIFTNTIHAQQWNSLGLSMNGFAWAMTEYNGALYLGGNLPTAPNQSIGILRYDGTQLDTLPGTHQMGSNFIVYDFAVYNNELYFCGTMAGFNHVAKWNGTTFSAVPNSFPGTISALEVFQGELYAAGPMQTVSGITANGIMRWNGSQWSGVGGGISASANVFDLEVHANELYAAGAFYFAQASATGIVRWNGQGWSGVGPGGVDGTIKSICSFNGELYVAGSTCRLAGGVPVHGIARWNGSTWAAVTDNRTQVDQYEDLYVYNGELYVAGNFVGIDGDTMRNISRYDGTEWNSVGGGVDDAFGATSTFVLGNGDTVVRSTTTVTSMHEWNGELYVTGIFDQIGGIQAGHIARWSVPLNAASTQAMAGMRIFPNPAQDYLILDGPATRFPCAIEIRDLHGRLIHQQALSETTKMDLTTLPSGMYLLQCHNNTGRFSYKFSIAQ